MNGAMNNFGKLYLTNRRSYVRFQDRGALPFDQKVPTKELTVRSGNQAAVGWFLGSKRNFLDKNFEISKIAALGPAAATAI